MSKKEKGYVFLKELKEKPILKPKVGKESIAQKIVTEFLESGLSYAEIQIPKDKTDRSIMIGLGRYISRSKDDSVKNLEVRKDTKGKIILLKKS